MYPFFQYSFKRHYFQHDWYNVEFLRLLGAAPYGGCDAAEFLQAVASILPNNAESWEVTFVKIAERTEAIAKDAEKRGLKSAARASFLRAANYYRMAQYLYPAAPESDQDRLLEIYSRSIASFDSAVQYFDHPVHRVAIPHTTLDGRQVSLPGRLYLPNPERQKEISDGKTPVAVCIGGADSTQEELYFMHVADGPGLGYAVLTFDGPGQGELLRRGGIALRPDYEHVIPDVLDWLEVYSKEYRQISLNMDAVVLVGQSMGAFLALRAAVDPRVRAVVAIDAFYDLWELAMTRMPSWVVKLWEKQFIITDAFIDWTAHVHGNVDIATRYSWGLATKMFGIPSGAATLRNMKNYTFKIGKDGEDDYLAQVRCPVLLSRAGSDKNSFSPAAATECLHRGLRNVTGDDKQIWVGFTFAEGGGQGKVGAWSLLQYRTYKFLDEKLKLDPARSSSKQV